jgi:hypothetical protein
MDVFAGQGGRVVRTAIQRLACSRHRSLQTPDRGILLVVRVGGSLGRADVAVCCTRHAPRTIISNHCFEFAACHPSRAHNSAEDKIFAAGAKPSRSSFSLQLRQHHSAAVMRSL